MTKKRSRKKAAKKRVKSPKKRTVQPVPVSRAKGASKPRKSKKPATVASLVSAARSLMVERIGVLETKRYLAKKISEKKAIAKQIRELKATISKLP